MDLLSGELISKKELLEQTEISYGQLYRWKRKRLIPDEWFIRKSVASGQETFFPKALILARIQQILQRNEETSLDELAEHFSPQLSAKTWPISILIQRNIVTVHTLQLMGALANTPANPRISTSTTSVPKPAAYANPADDTVALSFEQILYLALLDQLLTNGSCSREEGIVMLRTLELHYSAMAQSGGQLIFLRKLGVPLFVLASNRTTVYFDPEAKMIACMDINQTITELKQVLF